MPGLEGDGDAGGGYAVWPHGAGLQVVDAVLVHDQFFGAQAVVHAGVVVEGAGDGGQQGALLGVGGAAHAAVAGVPAAFNVSGNHLPGVAEFFAALAQDVVVQVGVGLPGRHGVALFPALEPGSHGVWCQAVEAEMPAPVDEGFVRGAEAAGPVDGGGAAYTAALQYGDGTVGGGPAHAFLVEVGVGRQLVHLEVFLVIQPAFFHQDNGQALPGQDFRGGAATGTGADDDHIGFCCLVAGEGAGVGNLPAGGQAPGNGIIHGHTALRNPGSFRCF